MKVLINILLTFVVDLTKVLIINHFIALFKTSDLSSLTELINH